MSNLAWATCFIGQTVVAFLCVAAAFYTGEPGWFVFVFQLAIGIFVVTELDGLFADLRNARIERQRVARQGGSGCCGGSSGGQVGHCSCVPSSERSS